MIKTQAEVALMTNEEIDKVVHNHLNTMIDGGTLDKEEIEYDKMLKVEYYTREEAGLHEIPCMICTDYDVSYYDIAKHFCSHVEKMTGNICDKHKLEFMVKLNKFLDKKVVS